MITLLANCFVPFKWTPKLRSLRGLLRSLVVKSLIDNIFIKTLGFSLLIHIDYLFTGSESLTQKLKRNAKAGPVDKGCQRLQKTHIELVIPNGIPH